MFVLLRRVPISRLKAISVIAFALESFAEKVFAVSVSSFRVGDEVDVVGAGVAEEPGGDPVHVEVGDVWG